MKNAKHFNDFETLSTYTCINKGTENKKVNNNTAENKENKTMQSLKVCVPKRIEDINEIIESVKIKEPVIVDLTYKTVNLKNKVLNYLSGAVFALNGSINNLVDNMYLILPKDVILKQ